jgi:tetratricopeptide (TPR) repeat protein
VLEEASELATNSGSGYGKGFSDIIRVWIHYDEGEYEKSEALYNIYLDWLYKRSASTWEYYEAYSEFFRGLLDVKSGKFESAKNRVKTMMDQEQPHTGDLLDLIRYQAVLLEVEILLAEGNFEQAVDIGQYVTSINPPPIRYDWRAVHHNLPFWKDVLARAYQRNGDLEKAILEYERLMNISSGSNSRLLIHPKYHFRLAKLYEKKGWKDKAIDQYAKFHDLWKNADPGHPEVIEARERVKSLQ